MAFIDFDLYVSGEVEVMVTTKIRLIFVVGDFLPQVVDNSHSRINEIYFVG